MIRTLSIVVTLLLTPSLASAWDYKQTQYQGQSQGQIQSQGQANDQTIAPSQNVRTETTFDRYAPTVVAPGLTAAGTGVCLGSVSFGLSGPMAGVAAGWTKVDEGCERRSGAALLFNMGHPGAALRVLAGESISDAMAAEGILRPRRNAAAPVAPDPTPTVSSTNFGTR